jgi:HlyD family secretion protein
MKKTIAFIKRHLYMSAAVVIVLIAGVAFAASKSGGDSVKDTIVVHPQDFAQQISVSGTVAPAESVDLGFAESARVTGVYAQVGDQVTAGEKIVQLDDTDAAKTVADAQNSLQSAQLALQELQYPDQVTAEDTQNALTLSQETLSSDEANLSKDYTTGYSNVSSAFIDIPTTLNDINNMLTDSSGLDSESFRNLSTGSNYLLTAGTEVGNAESDYTSNLDQYKLVSPTSATSTIAALIAQTKSTLEDVSTALNETSSYIAYADSLSPSSAPANADLVQDKATVTSDLAKINADLSSLTSSTVSIQNDGNTILADQATVMEKQDTVNEGGSSPYTLQADELAVTQQQTNLANAQADLANYVITAPFDGIVTTMNAKVGETVSLGTSDVSINSNGVFQIQSYVPEVYISNLQVGDMATTTLDAYGPDVFFPATVISIDPAQTVVNGVSNYKTTLQFTNADPRIKAGMTANVSITTANVPDALVVPQGSVFTQNGQQYVQVKQGKKIINQQVTTGTASSVGEVQVTSGLSDGDIVVLDPSM